MDQSSRTAHSALAPYWVGTSWKMNKTLAEGLAFAEALSAFVPGLDARIQPFILPPFTSAREVKRALASTRTKVGAQNMHWADEGAWTGEISPVMLRDCGLDMVEIGHSERRAHFGETDRTVGLKTAAAIRHGLTPLICVGETKAERDAGRADQIIGDQVRCALQFLETASAPSEVLFAYEPVWAIGEGGTPAGASYVERQHAFIKSVAAGLLESAPRVLYGGSVNQENAAELIAQPGVDGLFIGRAAWDVSDYIRILTIVAATVGELPSPPAYKEDVQ
ncbi:triose-phosphate isomerase [Mesorhizobium sp. ES1-1]|uniref:triose-phosphate isomerase n=1 Tax=Mesorhizobium sp. ES1-1 TaxID=2876629 RepID=UPI001CC9ADC6|nr:triose-phosphate isomerase [Mesorhizobium sp. ES1-1]MBZ9676289.1 triose-phosphate isomerase [Mesorhizobium sp. ES1-1]